MPLKINKERDKLVSQQMKIQNILLIMLRYEIQLLTDKQKQYGAQHMQIRSSKTNECIIIRVYGLTVTYGGVL